MGKYRIVGAFLDRIFRNNLNANFDDINTDIKDLDRKLSDVLKNPYVKGIEVLPNDPTGDDLWEGRMWIVSSSATQLNAMPTAPVIDLVSTDVTTATIKLTTASTDAEDGIITTYEIYKDWILFATVTLAQGGTYQLTGLSSGTFSITAKGKDSGGLLSHVSNVVDATIADTVPPTVTASPAAGTYTSSQSVTLTGTDDSGGHVDIYYTLDGSTPTTSSNVYSGPIPIGATTTLKFIGKDSVGNISAVQTVTYTINDVTPPNPVTNLAIGTVTTTTIPITWALSTSADVTKQEVAYSSDGGATFTVASDVVNPSSTSYTITGLSPSTSYIVRVVAIDGAGNRSTAVTVNATTVTPDTTAPDDVTNLAASNVKMTSLTLSWTASTSTDVANYEVYQGSTLLGSPTATTYDVTGLTESTAYTFTVKTKDTSGNVSTGVSVPATTPANTAPTAPTIALVGTDSTSITIKLTTASTDAEDGTITTYEVYKDGVLVGTPTLAVNGTYQITGLSPSTTYSITAKGKDSGGLLSPASNSVSATIKVYPYTLTTGDVVDSGFTFEKSGTFAYGKETSSGVYNLVSLDTTQTKANQPEGTALLWKDATGTYTFDVKENLGAKYPSDISSYVHSFFTVLDTAVNKTSMLVTDLTTYRKVFANTKFNTAGTTKDLYIYYIESDSTFRTHDGTSWVTTETPIATAIPISEDLVLNLTKNSDNSYNFVIQKASDNSYLANVVVPSTVRSATSDDRIVLGDCLTNAADGTRPDYWNTDITYSNILLA